MLISFINTKKGGFVNVYRSTTYIVQFTQCSFATLSTLQYLKISATQQQVNNNSLSLLGTNKSGIDIVKMPMAAPSNRHLSKKRNWKHETRQKSLRETLPSLLWCPVSTRVLCLTTPNVHVLILQVLKKKKKNWRCRDASCEKVVKTLKGPLR